MNREVLNEKIGKRKERIEKLTNQLAKEKKALKSEQKQLENMKYDEVIKALADSSLSEETLLRLIEQEKQKRKIEGLEGE